jgi:release factor glutamine methyltransferase
VSGVEVAAASGPDASARGAAIETDPPKPTTVRAALAAGEARLAEAGCDTPRLDAELLLADALGTDRAALFADLARAVGGEVAALYAGRIERRALREPVAYILARRGFRRLELSVDRRVLIPRPETELLVEVALAALPHGGGVHDVGTGSGAVALALADERPDLAVSASDVSDAAVAVARANAERLGLNVAISVAPGLPPGEYDLVVANLPYVRHDEWRTLAPEITRWEPAQALLGGGADGLEAIRELVVGAPAGTRLALEHAPAQGAQVRALLYEAQSVRGLDGREHVTLGRAP